MRHYRKRILAIVLAAVMLFALASVTNAYTLTGQRLAEGEVLLFIPYSGFGDLTIEHFNSALWGWNQSLGMTIMRRDPELRHSDTNYPNGDGKNYIYKVNAGDTYLAQCTWYYNQTTGITLNADININSYYRWANEPHLTQYDVWTVFMHEAGHAAGLNHSSVNNAVMYPSVAVNTAKRELDLDDHSGIRAIYWD